MLSAIKRNIISWYPFKENAQILEIGVEANELCLIEDSKKIYIHKEGLECLNEKFDYVLLIGTLDYSDEILENENSETILLEYAKKHLKDDGKILIACENMLGLDKFCVYNKTKYKFSKNKLNNMLNTMNLENKKFYYVLPNYKSANVIFTDDFLPNEEHISRNFVTFSEEDIVLFDQVKKYRDLIQENQELFKEFANSFFLEVSKSEFEDNDIKFVSFSNIRKDEYKIKTIIKSEYVSKQAASDKSENHINGIKSNINIMNGSNIKTIDSFDEDKIISKFQKNVDTLDKVILKKLKNGLNLEAIQEIRKYSDFIIQNFEKSETENNVLDKYNIQYTQEDIQNLHFIKNGLWDLIFQNCFYINGEYYFYDQEWYEENIPVEFILYRAILYCTSLNKYISQEELYNNIGINDSQIQLFRQLDNMLQNNIRDDFIWNHHCRQNTIEKILNDENLKTEKYRKQIEELKAENQALKNDIIQKDEVIISKEQIISHKQDIINGIYNSSIWKMTEPLRKIRRFIKK